METLEERISAALTEALDRQAAGGFESGFDVGLGYVEQDGREGWIGLSMEDVSRIAAAAAKSWF